MSQAYSDPSRAADPHALPDIEVFYAEAGEVFATGMDDDPNDSPAGWYWWSCSPGCLPDGDPCGPFESEAAALMDARDHMGSGWHD
jgi:hypothetical protein